MARASEGQEGCPRGREGGCRLKTPTAPSWEGGGLSPLLRAHHVEPWCPHSAPRHTDMLPRAHGAHTPAPSVPSPPPATVCSAILSPPHVPLSPCHQCRVLHGHTFTRAHTHVGAVSAASLRPPADPARVCPQVCATTRPSPSPTSRTTSSASRPTTASGSPRSMR